jgi:hypothetical protein
MKHFDIKPHYSLDLVNDWNLVWDFQKAGHSFPFTNNEKVLTIKIWESSAFDKRSQSRLGSMFAYAEVSDEADGELWHQSFFGETSGDDAFRWANDKADKEIN